MSTATAPVVTSKSERASELRTEVQSLTGELQQLRKKLAETAGNLALLEDRRRVMAEEIADGKPQKSSSAEIHAKIDEAQLPVGVLQKRVNEKQVALDTVRANLETLNREIAIEAQAAARRARFQELEKEINEAAVLIGENIRALVEDDLPRFDAARDALTTEFVGQFAEVTGPEGRAARELIHRLEAGWRDGSFLRTSRKLLRAGWQERGDIVFEIKNLRPPKQ
jgi:chromosome segregation ATPase